MELYPLTFIPVYKDYPWGGRNFEIFGRELPEGINAESWEISCHPDGTSIVSNGKYAGTPLPELIKQLGCSLIGTALPERDVETFPLLVKLIDAENKLSVQVHPDDEYALEHEGEYGKNEMWYIISAKPGSTLIYDVVPGTTRESFAKAVADGTLENCLKKVEVFPGDVINIPAGLIHAIGEGIMLAEIQQNSNTTYRVFDYNRVGKDGKKRPLHIEKSLDVIDFNTTGRKEKSTGLKIKIGENSTSTYVVANKYFAVEILDINGTIEQVADGSRFCMYTFTEGEGRIIYGSEIDSDCCADTDSCADTDCCACDCDCNAEEIRTLCDSDSNSKEIEVKAGVSVLIPAAMGRYIIEGKLKGLKSYVPDLQENIITPLKNAGYSEEQIYENVSGLQN